jgi:hypothetical protein
VDDPKYLALGAQLNDTFQPGDTQVMVFPNHFRISDNHDGMCSIGSTSAPAFSPVLQQHRGTQRE